MARTKYGKTRTVPYKRKRERKTNYRKRLALIKSGQSRLVIRKSLNTIIVQIVKYDADGDRVVAAATSHELRKAGWKMHTGNIPSAYLTGFMLGRKAKKNKIETAVFDAGLQTPKAGGRTFAALKGVIDAGLAVNCGEKALPSQERISGKHISEYAKKLKSDQQNYKKQFFKYIKEGIDPEQIVNMFEQSKRQISSM